MTRLDELEFAEAAGGRGKPWREATRRPGWRGERAVATAIAVLANALACGLLLRAMEAAPPVADAVSDDAITVVWIERPRPPVAKPEAVPVPDVAEPVPQAVVEDAPVVAPDVEAPPPATTWAGGQIPADEDPLPVGSPPMEDENGRPIAAGPDALERGDAGRSRAFGERPVDQFERQADGPFRMQDNSLGGRMQRMTKRADCAELKARLRAGEDVEAIVRTMVEMRCS